MNKYGIKAMLLKNNIDPIILDQFEFYKKNQNDENVYQMLIDKYGFKTKDDIALLVTFIETFNKIIELSNMDGNTVQNDQQKVAISYSCALAIAGALAATAGLAFVTGGAGLIVALIGKGLATASLIDSCS